MKISNIGFHWKYVTEKTPVIMLALGSALLAIGGTLLYFKDEPLAAPYMWLMIPCFLFGGGLIAFTKKLSPTEVKENAVTKAAENISDAVTAAQQENIEKVVEKAVDNVASVPPTKP